MINYCNETIAGLSEDLKVTEEKTLDFAVCHNPFGNHAGH